MRVRGDGDGWAFDAEGRRRWGRHGAAGLLVRAPLADGGGPVVLLQFRARWSHQGGSWALVGGARDSHEDPVAAALREAREEAGLDPAAVRVRAAVASAGVPGGWRYTTVVADAAAPLPVVLGEEGEELAWVPEGEVAALPLHEGLAVAWPGLRARGLRLVVDTANLLGSRPDGWWRDRAGATSVLLGQLASAVPRTVPLPDGGFGWLEGVEAVLEGTARGAAAPDGTATKGVRVHLAPGGGDDHILRVATVPAAPGVVTAVVTADKGLVARLPSDVAVLRPREVLGWLV